MSTDPRTQVPEALLKRIVEVWHPLEVRQFGSRARGVGIHASSDWDLLVIVPDDTPDDALDLDGARRRVRDLHLRTDIIPVRSGEFEDGREHFGTLAQIVETEGRVVHAR